MTHKTYSKTYLTEVIFQISFDPLLELYNDKKSAASDFQNLINNEFPELHFEENKKLSFEIDNTGHLVESKTHDKVLTWIFTNESGKQVSLNGKGLILSYSGELYSSFKDFSDDVKLVLEALKQYNLPQIRFIGLRYINQIRLENDDNNNLSEYINHNLNLINNEFDKDELIQSINKTDLRVQDYDLTFQFGQFNPEFPNVSSKKDFILDYDCKLTVDEPFKYIMLDLEEMHEIISDRFEHDITDKLREKMR